VKSAGTNNGQNSASVGGSRVNATAFFCYPAANVLLQYAERHMASTKHAIAKFGEREAKRP
jgi:hypothetical protein